MRSALIHHEMDAALRGEPWSLSGVIHGFESYLDADGRPVYEGRAPAGVKEGVAMTMRRCPYPDRRENRWINVSALAQVTENLDGVLEDMARFRASIPEGTPSWERMCLSIMDQLAGPAVHLLQHPSRRLPTPTDLSVGYKITVGYMTPLKEMLTLEAQGIGREVSLESFLAILDTGRFLVGAREACAGPPNLLRRVSSVLLHGCQGVSGAVARARVSRARRLTLQVELGIVWRLFDLAVERRLLVSEIGKAKLRPRTPYLRRKLDERITSLGEQSDSEVIQLPTMFGESRGERLAEMMRGLQDDQAARPEIASMVGHLLSSGDSAIGLPETDSQARFARLFELYLGVYSELRRTLTTLELELRTDLEVALNAPVKLDPGILPLPRALGWFELILGYRLRADAPQALEWVLRNQYRSMSVPAC